MTEQTATEPLSARLGLFGKLDNVVYRVEMTAVVTASVLMSVMVFTDVVYQLSVTIGQHLERGESAGYLLGGAVLGFIGLMAFAATGDTRHAEARVGESLAKPMPVRIGAAVVAMVLSALLGFAVTHIESSTLYRVLLVVGAIPVAQLLWQSERKAGFVTFIVGSLVALLIFGRLPSGYSWAQSYSLILLLWTSFLGASIAARERRHLRVDLARKLMPPSKLAWFNMVSYLFAAAFTAIIFYLGFIYILGADSTYLRPVWDPPTWLPEATRTMLVDEFPLPADASTWRRALQVFFAPSEPGELPDWLKVAAIPVSMALVCVRFFGHAIAFAMMGARGEEFVEQMGTH